MTTSELSPLRVCHDLFNHAQNMKRNPVVLKSDIFDFGITLKCLQNNLGSNFPKLVPSQIDCFQGKCILYEFCKVLSMLMGQSVVFEVDYLQA